jgi:signal peptidase I
MTSWIKKSFKQNKSFILFIFLMLFFRSAVADWNDVPTGSMKPTIVEGDRILINKLAYDVKVPFTDISLIKLSEPRRNDIIIFNSKVAEKRLVKRLIGLPGDVISMHDNHLVVNGKALNYEEITNQGHFKLMLEVGESIEHKVKIAQENSYLSNFPAVKVPKDHYLVLGDNRNNSADSRVIGFVPRAEIIGRAKKVVFSLDYDNYFLPRTNRFLHTL